MIGFVISSHGQFGTVHPDGRRDEGLSIAFSCGLTSPIDVLLKEYCQIKKYFITNLIYFEFFTSRKANIEEFSLLTIFQPIYECRSLINKPKICIIQVIKIKFSYAQKTFGQDENLTVFSQEYIF